MHHDLVAVRVLSSISVWMFQPATLVVGFFLLQQFLSILLLCDGPANIAYS
jgi:hypothetical protein